MGSLLKITENHFKNIDKRQWNSLSFYNKNLGKTCTKFNKANILRFTLQTKNSWKILITTDNFATQKLPVFSI